MPNEFGDALPGPRVPHADDALRTAARYDGPTGGKRIDRALGRVLIVAHGNLQLLAGAIEVPQTDLVIQPARCYPVLKRAGRRDALDIVGVEANGLRREDIFGSRPPDLDGDVGGCRDEGAVVLDEGDVVDPVGVGLHLLAELRRRRLVARRIRVGEGIPLLAIRTQIEVQVPGAYNAVAAARVAVPR